MRKIGIILTMSVALMAATACGKAGTADSEVTPVVTNDVTQIPENVEETETPQATELAVEGENTETQTNAEEQTEAVETEEPKEDGIAIYYGDANAEYILSTTIPKQEVTPELLLGELAKHDVLPTGIGINHINVEENSGSGTTLAVDFSQDFQEHLFSQGTAGEFIMMGSVVNTFLKAYGADSMTITVDGNMLESGHCIYENSMTYYEPDNTVSAEQAMEAMSKALGVE